MSLGLKRGTVAVEPHRIEWEIAAQEVIHKLKFVLCERNFNFPIAIGAYQILQAQRKVKKETT